jgi:hypothetical protein
LNANANANGVGAHADGVAVKHPRKLFWSCSVRYLPDEFAQ